MYPQSQALSLIVRLKYMDVISTSAKGALTVTHRWSGLSGQKLSVTGSTLRLGSSFTTIPFSGDRNEQDQTFIGRVESITMPGTTITCWLRMPCRRDLLCP